MFGTKYSINQWTTGGCPSSKVVMGMPTYGRGFTVSGDSFTPGSPASGASAPGPYTGDAGFLGYYEICDKVNSGWTPVFDETLQSMYAYGDGEWVGYENVQTFQLRCDFINAMELGGAMVWDISTDDVTGQKCGQGEYPLVNTLKTCLNTGDSNASYDYENDY